MTKLDSNVHIPLIARLKLNKTCFIRSIIYCHIDGLLGFHGNYQIKLLFQQIAPKLTLGLEPNSS